MKTIHLPEAGCPYCGNQIDAASDATGDEAPSEGDFSMCLKCGEWLVFTEGMRLRKPTEDELYEIGLNQDCQRMREVWATIYKRRQKGN